MTVRRVDAGQVRPSSTKMWMKSSSILRRSSLRIPTDTITSICARDSLPAAAASRTSGNIFKKSAARTSARDMRSSRPWMRRRYDCNVPFGSSRQIPDSSIRVTSESSSACSLLTTLGTSNNMPEASTPSSGSMAAINPSICSAIAANSGNTLTTPAPHRPKTPKENRTANSAATPPWFEHLYE